MKEFSEQLLFLLCCIVLLLLFSVVYVFAQETGDTEEVEAESEEDFACGQAMIENGAQLVDEYETFLSEYFKIDDPSSNQVEEAMDYYRFIEDSLNSLYESKATIKGAGVKTLGFASDEITYCSYIRDQYIKYARALLQKQALASANSKTTFEVVDGLKVLNKNLENFSEDFLEVFPGIFNQMNNALPCYARQCILK